MKKLITFSTFLIASLAITSTVFAAKPTSVDSNGVETAWTHTSCTTIQDGTLSYSSGHYLNGVHNLETGFDEFGYNYQGHMFDGSYANVYLGAAGFPPYEGDDAAYQDRLDDEGYTTDPYSTWYWPYRNWNLLMKWDDQWLANTDCDGDNLLDRHYGSASYQGTGAWITNHLSFNGENYYTKIVAAPSDATVDSGYWYTADGTEIGPVIWSEFAIIQDIASGIGPTYVSPNGPGMGQY